MTKAVFIDFAEHLGLVWWRERSKPTVFHGPFDTQEEAQRDSETAVFGPQCKIKEGGRLDDATWKALAESAGATKQ